MSELRVPMNASTVEITCADGRSFVGRVFVPAHSSRHSGPMRVEEWMNESASFFALMPSDGSEPMLLNKREVLVLTAKQDDGGVDVEMDTGEEMPRKQVMIELMNRHLEGEIIIDMPSSQSRVLDYLNRDEEFLTLREGCMRHLVRKARITRVIELRNPRNPETDRC